ncbi:DUF2752 domain-containing protein [Streptomyces sp. NBC_01335]|uniref:DUF2752 domain-containing protein n=1 Tax=Streptomyces sp. NBC_01335 TaxID=2903828 RepID=UPI002E147469|nr:DUF2752 domain-containing protein [Streptomyces sp. NBC_01335]
MDASPLPAATPSPPDPPPSPGSGSPAGPAPAGPGPRTPPYAHAHPHTPPYAPPHAPRRPAHGLRRFVAPAATLAAVAGAFGYVATVDPNEPGHYPVCPLFRLTGLLCPGCGGLRSAHAFATGDFATALGDNALAVTGYVLFAAFWTLWLVRTARGQPLRMSVPPRWWWGIGAVALVFSVVRNLPFGTALAP